MKYRCEMIFTIAAIVAVAALPANADTLVAETASPCVYTADTRPSPRAITTVEELTAITTGTKASSWRRGETVTLTAPDGTKTTLANAESASWSGALPFDAGGLWTAQNSRQGSASFTLRHSFFGTLGDGTAASPAKLVDADELVDYSVADGYVFALTIDESSLLAALKVPTGFGIAKMDGGRWRLVYSPDGLVFDSGVTLSYVADSRLPGPDRKLYAHDAMSVAYSCDNWMRASQSASSLTLTRPSGAASASSPVGTGVVPLSFDEPGDWTISLVAGGRSLISTVTVRPAGFFLIVR